MKFKTAVEDLENNFFLIFTSDDDGYTCEKMEKVEVKNSPNFVNTGICNWCRCIYSTKEFLDFIKEPETPNLWRIKYKGDYYEELKSKTKIRI